MPKKYAVICRWLEDNNEAWDVISTNVEHEIAQRTHNDMSGKVIKDDVGNIWLHTYHIITMDKYNGMLKLEETYGKLPCTCMCHQDGFQTMHIMPCCEFTYEKYINQDGSIDNERYNKLINEKENNTTSTQEE